MSKIIYSFLGDYYHNHDDSYEVIKKVTQTVGGIDLFDEKIENIEVALAKNPDVLIIYKENRLNPNAIDDEFWLTPEIDEKIYNYVKNGGKIIGLHAGISSYPSDSKYMDILKGKFLTHPEKMCEVKYVFDNPQAVGYKELIDYTIVDEHYFTAVDVANTTVFLRSVSEHGEYPAGWYHPYEKGYVICVTPAHSKEGLNDTDTLNLYTHILKEILNK